MSKLGFFSQLVRNPAAMAAVAPSGAQLSQAMVQALTGSPSHVVELGPGTGPITQALLDAGFAPRNILAIEQNRKLGQALARRHPGVSVFMTDARHVRCVLRDMGWPPNVSAVVSSLPLRAMPPTTAQAIMRAVQGCLCPGGVLVQFSYGLSSPVSRELAHALGWKVEQVAQVWRNLPPARVWRYTQL